MGIRCPASLVFAWFWGDVFHGFEEPTPMTDLSEDPTYVAGGLLLLAVAFLVALKTTQQGKYLVRAGVALGLALVVVVIEWLWVTDNERIEQVVYELRQAVLSSDTNRVLSHMAPNVQYLHGETALSEDMTRALIRENLSRARFESVWIGDLQISSGHQSRRGKAEFRVFTRGHLDSPGALEGGTAVTTWSLGFQETTPSVWKVNRISPVSIPRGILALPGGVRPTDGSHLGYDDGIGLPRPQSRAFDSRRSGLRPRGLAKLPDERPDVPNNGPNRD
jgi:hypothetical protein